MDALLPRPLDEMLRLLAAQSLDHAIMLVTTDGRIAWFSRGAEHIFGYRSADIVGKPLETLFVPEDVALGVAKQELDVARHGDAAEDDRYQLRADGSRFWATGVLVPLCDADGRYIGFGKILRNRTDLKEQVEAFRNQAAEAESAARRKDVFMATLSHELRNPLAPLANAVRIIRLAVPPNDDLEYALKVIERQMAVLQRLVDDMLDVSRAGAGKIELHRRMLVLQEVLRQAVDSTRPGAKAGGHRLDVVLTDGDIVVEGDADRLHQVFVNLIGNAVKFTPPGGRIWVKATVEPGEAVVRIEDNGAGIAHEMLPRIFDLFTQNEATRPMSQGGLGIGLALVKDLVALHGGSVQARSEGAGKGSQFIVRLPLPRGGSAVDAADREPL